jgi:hypothetical protein
MWMTVHISLLRELIRGQSQRYVEMHAHVRKWCMQEWQNTESELTRERGLWGPEERSKLDKFQLDMTEGPSRVRKTLIPDPKFYHRYPYRPNLELPEAKPLRSKFASSRDSRAYYEQMKTHRFRTMDERIVDRQTASSQSTVLLAKNGEDAGFDPFGELNLSMIKRMVKKSRDEQKESNETDGKGEEVEEAAVVEDDLPEDPQSPLAQEHDSEKDCKIFTNSRKLISNFSRVIFNGSKSIY